MEGTREKGRGRRGITELGVLLDDVDADAVGVSLNKGNQTGEPSTKSHKTKLRGRHPYRIVFAAGCCCHWRENAAERRRRERVGHQDR